MSKDTPVVYWGGDNPPLGAYYFRDSESARRVMQIEKENQVILPEGTFYVEEDEVFIVKNPAEDGLDTNNQW